MAYSTLKQDRKLNLIECIMDARPRRLNANIPSWHRAKLSEISPMAVPAAVIRTLSALRRCNPGVLPGPAFKMTAKINDSRTLGQICGNDDGQWRRTPAPNMAVLDWLAKSGLDRSDRMLLDSLRAILTSPVSSSAKLQEQSPSWARIMLEPWPRRSLIQPVSAPIPEADFARYLQKLEAMCTWTENSLLGSTEDPALFCQRVTRWHGDHDRRFMGFLPFPGGLNADQELRLTQFWFNKVLDPFQGEGGVEGENTWGHVRARDILDGLIRHEAARKPNPEQWDPEQTFRFALWAMHFPFDALDTERICALNGNRCKPSEWLRLEMVPGHEPQQLADPMDALDMAKRIPWTKHFSENRNLTIPEWLREATPGATHGKPDNPGEIRTFNHHWARIFPEMDISGIQAQLARGISKACLRAAMAARGPEVTDVRNSAIVAPAGNANLLRL